MPMVLLHRLITFSNMYASPCLSIHMTCITRQDNLQSALVMSHLII